MPLMTATTVKCPSCGADQPLELVQSLDATKDTEHLKQLMSGTLNLFKCPCGKQAQLVGRMLYSDSVRGFFCQVCPGGPAEVEKARAAFTASGVNGVHRIVPSLNALIEKVKVIEAGLDDWAVELTKVLLLTSIGPTALNRVLLFEGVDSAQFSWVLFDDAGATPSVVHSPVAPYARARETWLPYAPAGEPLVDRKWAVETMERVVAPKG